MQGNPLAEHISGRKPRANSFEVLNGIEGARAAARRVEVVGDDDVVARIGSAHETSRIGLNQIHVREAVTPQLRSEIGRRIDHLLQELHRIDLQRRICRGRGSGDARAEAEKERVARRRVKQQRQQRLPRIREHRRAAAFLCTIVDVQPRNPASILDDAHRGRHTVPHAHDASVLRNIDKRE